MQWVGLQYTTKQQSYDDCSVGGRRFDGGSSPSKINFTNRSGFSYKLYFTTSFQQPPLPFWLAIDRTEQPASLRLSWSQRVWLVLLVRRTLNQACILRQQKKSLTIDGTPNVKQSEAISKKFFKIQQEVEEFYRYVLPSFVYHDHRRPHAFVRYWTGADCVSLIEDVRGSIAISYTN